MNTALETRDRAINFVKSHGPVLPFQIAKEINTNILMASAHLSELVASNILKVSHIKVGGSPLYYAPGQEPLLQKYSSNLNEKEKKVYDLLSQKKIVLDSELEPVVRVALREIKDFAIPLQVTSESKNYIFWKWYLTPKNEAELIVNQAIADIEKAEKGLQFESIRDKHIEVEIEKKIGDAITPSQKPLELVQQFQQEILKPIVKQDIKDDLYKTMIDFFEKNRINVQSFEIIKKNLEMDFIIDIPSAFGSLTYYCKSKTKKRVNDSDLSSAYLKGQLKKLPVLFLSRGDLSKKAAEMLKNELKGLNFKKI